MFFGKKDGGFKKLFMTIGSAMIVISCANVAYAQGDAISQGFLMKTQNNNVVLKLYDIGSTNVDECCREGDVYACKRYENAYSGLLSLCGSGNSLACHSYATLNSLYTSCLISMLGN